MTSAIFFSNSKGQLILKANWHATYSPKKQTDKSVLSAFLLFTANKSNSSVCFLGESMARQSAFRFHLTFRNLERPGLIIESLDYSATSSWRKIMHLGEIPT